MVAKKMNGVCVLFTISYLLRLPYSKSTAAVIIKSLTLKGKYMNGFELNIISLMYYLIQYFIYHSNHTFIFACSRSVIVNCENR